MRTGVIRTDTGQKSRMISECLHNFMGPDEVSSFLTALFASMITSLLLILKREAFKSEDSGNNAIS